MTEAIFTLYQTVTWSVAETVPDNDSVHTRNATFGTISAPDEILQHNEALVPLHTAPN